MTTTGVDIAPAPIKSRYSIRLGKIRGNRSLPYWDTLLVNRNQGTVTFSVTLRADFRDGKAYGRHSHNGEEFGYEIELGGPLQGRLHWRQRDAETEAPDEDTEAYVEEDDGQHKPDPKRRFGGARTR